jgi:GNAT superfamily N-acetyltransferase
LFYSKEEAMAAKARARPRVTVRAMKQEDIDGVLAIDRKLRGPKRAITFSNPRSDYIGGELGISCVACRGNQIVGFMMGRLGRRMPEGTLAAWIEIVGVDPDAQKGSIGKKLMEYFEGQCRKKGATHINMLTFPQDNLLKPYLEAMGFVPSAFIQLEKKL